MVRSSANGIEDGAAPKPLTPPRPTVLRELQG